MKKIILMRHSIPERLKLPTEQLPLSEEGKELARSKSEIFANIDKCYTSSYKRAFETAQILSRKPITMVDDLHERIVGEAREDFWLKQYQDHDYHNPGGESLNMVRVRMKGAVDGILREMDDGNTALVVSHATAICSYLLNFCKIQVADAESKSRIITFGDQEVLHGKIKHLDCFEIAYKDDVVSVIRFCGRDYQ